MTRPGKRPIRVLVIDDSALVREVLARILAQDPSLAVVVAADPLIAIKKMEVTRPDVIVLDLAMPRMDGLSFLRRQMAVDPIPVVVCSAMAGGSTDAVLRALEDGAVDVIRKPHVGIRDFLEDSTTLLLDAIHAAAGAKVTKSGATALPLPVPAATAPRVPAGGAEPIIAIGASTGGTEALGTILRALPEDSPGVAVVQHMPEGFTAAFARRLDGTCRVSVAEAKNGDRLQRGRALVAPGNRHLVVHRERDGYFVEVVDGPLVSRHRPSVDVLFRSIAEAAAHAAVGAILTGMGNDGADGMLEMRQAGAATIAQDEATSVVFGMPREAILRGGVDDVVPLPRIASVLLDKAMRRARSARAS